MAEAFGLNDELLQQFGMDDEAVGQSSVTKPPVKPGVGQVANAARYVPKQPQYTDAYVPSEDMPGLMTGMGPTRPVQNYTDQQMAGAEQGVNIDAPAPISTVRGALARTQKVAQERIAQEIQRKFGPDTPVRLGADSKTGNVEYYDKDAAQWKMVPDSPGAKAINAIPATGEALGAIGGSYLPGPPGVMTALGAGAGRTLGQGIKNLIGRDSADDPRDNQPALNAGLQSTAINLGLNAITGGIPTAYRLAVKGKDVVNAAEADSILASYNANKKYVDELEAATGQKYPANIGRVAAIPDKNGQTNPAAHTLVANEPLLLNYPELAKREVDRRANRENVIELYWSNQTKNPEAYANINQQNWQASVKQYYDAFKDGTLGPYQEAAEQAVLAAQKANENSTVGALDAGSMGELVRDTVLKAFEASKAQKSAAWAAYETAAGYVPGQVASDLKVPLDAKLASTMNVLEDLKQKGLLKSQASQAERYTPQIPEGETSTVVDAGGKPFKLSEGGTVDLAMVDRTIKDLNAEANQAAKGTVEGGMSTANRNLLLKNLKEARAEFLADKPEVANALAKAEAETARHSQEFKESFLGTFLVRDNAYGDMRLAAPDLLDKIMKNRDLDGARQLAELTNGEPGAKKAILDYVDAYYNTKFTKKVNGTLQYDMGKHEQFKREVLPSLEPFLTPAEYAKVGEIGGLARQVIIEKKKWQTAQKAWSAMDEGRLGSKLSSESLVNSFFDPNKSDKNFRFIRTYLGDEAVETTKAGIMSAITQKARDPVTGLVNVDKLAGIITPVRDRFEEYFGKEKMAALDTLIKTAQEERVGTATKPILSGDTFLSRVAKPILGPLSAENRKITFLKDLRTKNIAYKVEAAMYDPNELSRLAKEIRSRRPDAEYKARINAALTLSYEQNRRDDR